MAVIMAFSTIETVPSGPNESRLDDGDRRRLH